MAPAPPLVETGCRSVRKTAREAAGRAGSRTASWRRAKAWIGFGRCPPLRLRVVQGRSARTTAWGAAGWAGAWTARQRSATTWSGPGRCPPPRPPGVQGRSARRTVRGAAGRRVGVWTASQRSVTTWSGSGLTATVRPRTIALARARKGSPAVLPPQGRVSGVLPQSLAPAHSQRAAAVAPLGVPTAGTTRPETVSRSRGRSRGRRERTRPHGRVDVRYHGVRAGDPEARAGDCCAPGDAIVRWP
jgi:hypothetical protein